MRDFIEKNHWLCFIPPAGFLLLLLVPRNEQRTFLFFCAAILFFYLFISLIIIHYLALLFSPSFYHLFNFVFRLDIVLYALLQSFCFLNALIFGTDIGNYWIIGRLFKFFHQPAAVRPV